MKKIILNFSLCDPPKKREEYYNEYCKLYKKLNKNKILTDRRIINFLYCVEPKKGEEYNDEEYYDYDQYRKLYKKLNKGKPLEEIFRKDQDEYGYFLKIRRRSANSYKIELGDGSEGGGSSCTWYVTFDENDSATCEVGIINHWDC